MYSAWTKCSRLCQYTMTHTQHLLTIPSATRTTPPCSPLGQSPFCLAQIGSAGGGYKAGGQKRGGVVDDISTLHRRSTIRLPACPRRSTLVEPSALMLITACTRFTSHARS